MPVRSSATISAFDAKNRLGQLLSRVQAGEELTITRHGEPVAKLVPVGKRAGNEAKLALERLRKMRESLAAAGVKVSRDEVRAWKNEGRA